MDAERCQGRPVSGPTGRSRADTGDRQAEYVGRPGRDPLRGRQLSFGWSPVRRRHGRVDVVSATFAGPGDKDIRVRAGKRAEPGWLAKPAKRTEPNISRANESSGFRSRRPKAGESPAMRRPSTLQQVEATKGRPGPTLMDGRTSRLRGARPTHCRRERRGGARRSSSGVATLFRSGKTEDVASIPGSNNVASADVVGTGREVGESRPEACRTACRVACGREEGTGGTVHCENARACTSGEIGRGGRRIRAGAWKGIAERQVGQQWQASREARAGNAAMTQSSDCRRTP